MAAETATVWLVEIRVKDWVHVPEGQSCIVTFEEVLATNEIGARHEAFDQFERRCRYEPVMRLQMTRCGLSISDCCAPDAVQVS